MTRFESFIHCRHECRPTVNLSVRAQLAGPIVVLIPGLTLKVGSNNPAEVRVAIPGTSDMAKIIANGLVPSLIRGVGVDGTIVCLRLGNLELLLLLTPQNPAQVLHDQKAFLLPHPLLLAMSQEAFQRTIPGTPIAIIAAGRRIRAITGGPSRTFDTWLGAWRQRWWRRRRCHFLLLRARRAWRRWRRDLFVLCVRRGLREWRWWGQCWRRLGAVAMGGRYRGLGWLSQQLSQFLNSCADISFPDFIILCTSSPSLNASLSNLLALALNLFRS